MSGPRVFDGKAWTPVVDSVGHTGSQSPVPPVEDGDGTIFVSIPSFRDGSRCAQTLKSIFENANNPEKVFVGLIEQNSAEEDSCLELYCKESGFQIVKKQKIRADMTKVVTTEEITKCPHFDQIRLLQVYNIAAKGPSDARTLTRKIVGNEEFCLQIDAHMSFTKDWDELAKQEWHKAENEFAVISTAPADIAHQSDYESWTGSKKGEVPRQCLVKIGENDIPDFVSPADGKVAQLEKPLLSHSWSAAFSFAKCHIEETTPYDPFTPYIMGAEQFPHFARFWTRGYDVYTPTRNIVYHDFSPNPGGHDMSEWFKRRRAKLRQESFLRIKSFLHIPGGDDSKTALANMGIYGLGKRRSLAQLSNFVGIKLSPPTSNKENLKCSNLEWVPYDSSITPMDNLYEDADDLDPQPIFPLRTELTFYEQQIEEPLVQLGEDPVLGEAKILHEEPNNPPVVTLLILWIFGLIVWCTVFVNQGGASHKPKRRKKRNDPSGLKNV